MKENKTGRKFSIYLIKKGVKDIEDIINNYDKVKEHTIQNKTNKIGTLFFRSTPLRPPRWSELFSSYIDLKEFKSCSTSAVLLITAASRLFAITFGYGRYLLKPGSYEEDFGLRTTLNSVNPEKIRAVDRKVIDASGRYSREQASKNIPIIEFGLEVDKDILKAVVGPPEDETLGVRLAGTESLSVYAKIDLTDASSYLKTCLKQYRKKTYKERFPWVDNIKEVKDTILKSELESDLELKIQNEEFEGIWIAVPDLMDWHDVAGFKYTSSDRGELYDDINLHDFLDKIRNPDALNVSNLKTRYIYCISADTEMIKNKWSVYKCMYAEISRENKLYMLNGGKWYEIEQDYVTEVDEAIGRIKRSRNLRLPTYDKISEAEYNQTTCEVYSTKYALMDRKTIWHGGGRSQIEFCDIFTNDNKLVHVKRYGGSNTLSHLFKQGTVSASLFLYDNEFRTKVNDELPNTHKFSSLDRPDASEYEVAYAIASRVEGSLVLPFFSRVTLRSAYIQLRNMGYKVTLTKIDCA